MQNNVIVTRKKSNIKSGQGSQKEAWYPDVLVDWLSAARRTPTPPLLYILYFIVIYKEVYNTCDYLRVNIVIGNANNLCKYWPITVGCIDKDWQMTDPTSRQRRGPKTKRKDSNFEKKNIYIYLVKSPRLGSTPRHTDWLTVSCNVTLTLTIACSSSFCLTITLFCFQCVLSDEKTGL
jgi:hypothetical protein